MNPSGALVIFVKTPGLSPVKTRLAAAIGDELSQEFYLRSVGATAALAKEVRKQIGDLRIYWAVAEALGLGAQIWSEFQVIYQGEGGLGRRLSHVYQEMLRHHRYVCFIGADSPHLDIKLLLQGIEETAKGFGRRFVIGESEDGGFYFFGGSLPLPEEDWTAVQYSQTQTAQDLTQRLQKHAAVVNISRSFDVDTIDDINRYQDASLLTPTLLTEQQDIIRWALETVHARDSI